MEESTVVFIVSKTYRVAPERHLSILTIFGYIAFFSWNLIFHCNLFDWEIEDLQRLLTSLIRVHLFPFVLDAKAWTLSSLCLFLVKLFLLALSNFSNSVSFHLAHFLWKSKVPSSSRPSFG